jgi:hypothetical protein
MDFGHLCIFIGPNDSPLKVWPQFEPALSFWYKYLNFHIDGVPRVTKGLVGTCENDEVAWSENCVWQSKRLSR